MGIISSIITWLTTNYGLLLHVESILIVILIIMIISIFLKSKNQFFTEITWIYSSFVPAFTILFLNYNPTIYLIAVYLFMQILFITLYIKSIVSNYNKIIKNTLSPLKKVQSIENFDYGKEKSLEYVGLFILPFITVNDSINILSVIVIIFIVVIIIKRFELFYLNLPILLFFRLQKIETNHRVKMLVLTPKDFEFELGKEYDIRSLIKRLNLFILLPNKIE